MTRTVPGKNAKQIVTALYRKKTVKKKVKKYNLWVRRITNKKWGAGSAGKHSGLPAAGPIRPSLPWCLRPATGSLDPSWRQEKARFEAIVSARMLLTMPAAQPPQPHTWQGICQPRLISLWNDPDTVATPLLSHRFTDGTLAVHGRAEVRPRTQKQLVAHRRACLRSKPSQGLPTRGETFRGSLVPNVAFWNQKKISRKAPGRWPRAPGDV